MVEPEVIFVPHRTHALRMGRDMAASREGGLFGTEVTALNDWLADRWELLGTGESPVAAMVRHVLMRRAFEKTGERDFTAGAVALAEKLARDSLPLLENLRADECVHLSSSECALVAALQRYAALLAEYGFIEYSQIIARLIDDSAFREHVPCPGRVRFAGFDEMTPLYRMLAECLGATWDKDGTAEVPWIAPDRVRFLLPAGDYATDYLIDEAIGEALREGPEGLLGGAANDASRGAFGAESDDASRVVASCSASDVAPQGVFGGVSRAVSHGALGEMPRNAPNAELFFAVVAMTDPLKHFECLRDALLRRGLSVGVQASTPFFDTPFGRGYRALLCFFECEDDLGEEALLWAIDFLESPLSDVSASRASGLKSQWLQDRTLTMDDIYQDLSEESLFFAEFEPGNIAEWMPSRFPAHVAAIERATEALRSVNAPMSELFALLETTHLSVSQLVCPAENDANANVAARVGADVCATADARATTDVRANADAYTRADVRTATDVRAIPAARTETLIACGDMSSRVVIFMTLQDAARLAPGSTEMLVIGDLSARAYPIRLPETAATLLMEKLGFADERDPLAAARHTFTAACAASRGRIVVERPLNDVNGDPEYPAAVLEDFLEQYRFLEAPACATPVRLLDDLPVCFANAYVTRGESALQENATCASRSTTDARPWHSLAYVDEQNRPLVALPRARAQVTDGGDLCGKDSQDENSRGGDSRLRLSASAIECYLDCPGKWFAERRLRLDEDRAAFGALEKGSFAHGVLEDFYQQFIAAGFARVTRENLAQALRLLDDVFSRHVNLPYGNGPNQNPYFARTSLEQQEVEALRRNLHALIKRDIDFLPRFRPAYFEYAFGADVPVPYAGALLRGSIDRIDMDESGHAVIVDYKGSVGEAHELASVSPVFVQVDGEMREVNIPDKIQALVYAQIARRTLGLDVVGALYVSYGRAGKVAGAYDAVVLGPQDIPSMREKKCAVAPNPGFTALLDDVEEKISLAIAQLEQGHLALAPRSADSCTFCPVKACDERRGG